MPVEYLKETPSQTAGPFVHIGTLPSVAGLAVRSQEKPNVLAGAAGRGQRIRVEGIVHDGAGEPVRDAVIELWQADAEGRYGTREFPGWGRAAADFKTGQWWFETVKPGPVAEGGTTHAPCLTLLILARGINVPLHTRLYFADEDKANAADPVLRSIPGAAMRETLIATRAERDGEVVYTLDIHLQGDRETVFFDA